MNFLCVQRERQDICYNIKFLRLFLRHDLEKQNDIEKLQINNWSLKYILLYLLFVSLWISLKKLKT